ncbi:MAG TPA: hypothetical protein VES95_09155 [Dermatophilaceae bacterium]|nr:hypothetical protein [Dermatophilaceae bacterium]
MTASDPRPREVVVELERVVRRWHELPLDHALCHVAAVRGVLDELAARTAPDLTTPELAEPELAEPESAASESAALELAEPGIAGPGPAVPDLGPAVLPDQLAVLVWDACALGRGDGIPELLAGLRRAVAGAPGPEPHGAATAR